MTNTSVTDFRIVRKDQGVDQRTQQLITHLHRGGALAFIQAFQGDRRRSAWYPVGKPLTPPAAWQTGHDLYFGVHPSSADESAKWVFRDGKRDQHGTYHASTNDCIAAVNCVFADHDGKDLTNPTQDEINAAFDILKAADLACVASGAKAKPQPDRALMNQAIGAAKDAKYQTDPDHYKALAKAHVDQLQPRPSVIVQSGGGWHCYWLLKDPFVITDEAKRDFAKRTQADWVRFVGGDPGAKDLRRILRLPGYRNYKAKYAPNFPVVSYEHFDLTLQYNLLDLVAAIPPAPVETTTATPTQRTATASPAGGNTPAAQTDKHGLIDWFNQNMPIGDILARYGYTGSGERMSRPGQPESNGVHIFTDNRSYHHSSNDPLWNDAGHRRSPFDAYCVFEHDGNVKAAVNALANAFFERLRLWVRSTSFADLVDPALRGQHYRTDATDTRCADAVIDAMASANRLQVTLSKRIGGRNAGVSCNTFENALERLQFMFDVGIAQHGYVITLNLACCTLITSDIVGMIRSDQSATSKNEYTPHKADAAFMSGVSLHTKRRISELAKVLEITDREAKEGYTLRALGETLLRCFDAYGRAGEMTVSEFAEETGKKIGAIRTALQYAVRLDLATYEQEHQKAPKVYSFEPDFWTRVDELRPNLRTYTLSEQRENQRLKQSQQWAHRGAALAKDEDTRATLNARLMRLANKRMGLISVAYADKGLSQEEIARIAFDTPILSEGRRYQIGQQAGRQEQAAALVAAVADLKSQGIRGKEAKRMLAMAGYTQADLRPSLVGAL